MQLEPIAIIGIGCRFPGADNPQAFWTAIRDGKHGIAEVPESRWDVDSYYDADPTQLGKANTRWGGFLEDIEGFDPQFFGIAPKEAVTMDPQQRLLLEVAWETLEDGGQIPEDIKGSKTGVFIGIGTHDYSIAMWQQPVSEPYATTGTGNCIAANRISYSFDLKGPSLAVDTACSSSLVAVHLACQSIWTGESTLALAGGVNMLLLPTIMVGFSKGGFMSAEGRCKSFDADADGYVRGEGAGLVLLKPLSAAIADGDDIYGTILSSAVNQDGLSNGLAAPNPEAQETVLREAYHKVGIDPAEVSYVEAHGTGTKVGDPIEANALGRVLGKQRQPGNNCLIGSVKTNIGHTETAAGIAGIIKVALALKHKQIPPSLNFTTPNPAIAFEDLNLEVVTELTPWESDKPLIAGVNSFGFGGTNAHIVMAEYLGQEDREKGRQGEGETGELNLLTLSAKSQSALKELAQGYRDFVAKSDRSLSEICTATQVQRSHFNHRLTCISTSSGQLQQQLAGIVANKETIGVNISSVGSKTKQVCWLFTGQGSQYVGMGQDLYQTQPVFRETLDRCETILHPFLDRPLLEVIFAEEDNGDLNRTVYTQPAIFAIEYALAQLWLSWGIKPDYVAGHSIGEYVAACVAGVFSLEDALKLVANRGRLMEELPSSGGMLAIFGSEAEIAESIAAYKSEVNIAAINHHQNTVIAGNSSTLAVIEDKLAQLDIASTLLEVSHAFHSPLMKPMLGDFRQVAETITYSLPQIPLVSNVTAQLVGEVITSPDYWIEHIVQPVKFADSFEFLLAKEINIFLEIGAKPILASIGATISANKEQSPLLLPSLSNKQPDGQVIFNSLVRLYHQGLKIDWRSFNHGNYYPEIKLPSYPFQRQRYWWDKAKFWTTEDRVKRSQLHPLLGNPLTLAGTSEIRWTSEIDLDTPAYLTDHRVSSEAVFPATAYIEMALAAGKYLNCDRDLQLQDFVIHQPLILSEGSTQLQTALSLISDSAYKVQIFSSQDDNAFILHSEVTIAWQTEATAEKLDLDLIKSRSHSSDLDIANYYQSLSQQGLNYGANFQNIEQIWRGEKEALGYIQLADDSHRQATNYQIHPALLDACLQLIGTVTDASAGVYLPVAIESLDLIQSGCDRVWAYVTVTQNEKNIQADLILTNDREEIVAKINDLSLQYLNRRSLEKIFNLDPVETNEGNSIDSWLYELDWQQKDIENDRSIDRCDRWLIFATDNKALEIAADLNNAQIIDPNSVEDWQKLWQTIDLKPTDNLNIAYFVGSEIDTNCIDAGILDLMQSFVSADINLVQLNIITHQTQYKTVKTFSGAVWGLGRTIQQEYPHISCKLIDLDDLLIIKAQLCSELLTNDGETQVVYHQQQRYVPRLVPKNNTLDRPYRLQLSNYGTLDNLSLAPMQRRSPAAGEIEIAVAASGVNFRDVLNALGVLEEYLKTMGFEDATEVPFGGECAGTVVAVGSGVSNFKVGDEVIAAQAVGSLSSHVTVNAKFAIAKPKNLSYTEAATIPTTFLTAYYGLHYLAKIEAGDKILIHSAAGGVGQAAVQIAQQVGAEVYATASTGKWDFLKGMGIKYVMNSRNLDFAEEVMQLTGGKGVDLVLNSFNGEFIPRSLDILAPQGRFVEIGKVGIWDEAQVAAKRNDVSYFPFDLLEVSDRDRDLITTMFAELREQFMARKLKPLPHQVFGIQQAGDAFRYMAQAKHIGKVVIELSTNNQIVKTDSCYLITGGMGALGLEVAGWLATEGAKHLILLGRSQPSNIARDKIAGLQQRGITVETVRADISNYDAVKDVIASLSLPLRGVIHAAGILDDGLLKNISRSRFDKVIEPKAAGAWNLHLATENLDLDWFVCFSSIVSVFGAAGQSNYATANAFMDNLMNYRRDRGLPGLSINWSIWSEVGMASRLTTEQQQRLSQQGLTPIPPQQGLDILKRLLQQQAQQTIVFPVDWETFLSQQLKNPLFERVQPKAIQAKTATTSFLQQLAQTDPNEQGQVLQSHLRVQIAKVLGFADPEDVDTEEKFADLGMDSLMAVEFKNNLQTSFGSAISLTAAFDHPNVELLTAYISQELAESGVLNTVTQPATKVTPRPKQKPVNKLAISPTSKPDFTPVTRSKIDIKPEYTQFSLSPEYINLNKDLQRVEKLGNPFFSLHQGIAQDTIQTDNRSLINYSSYNYLGMSGDPTVIAATQKAIAEYGTSVSASRVLSGERPIHLELEREIADFIGTEAAITFVGGHATNVSTIGHLFGKEDLIICDSLSHNSIREGCNLSGAKIIEFPHNDCQALEKILASDRPKYQKVLIAIEGIYSTDGDLAPLPEIIALKKHYQTFLLVDEAHSIGVLGLSGGGIREHYNLKASDVDLWMGTLSKSFASCGGYIATSKEIIEYLKYTAPGFVFSVGMSPANTASALAAIRLLKAEPERAIKLQSRAKFCLDLARSKGLNTGYSADSPVIPVIVGEPHKAVTLSKLLNQQGINVNPMVFPSVAYDAARLRFFITSLHTETQIQQTITALVKALSKLD